MRPALVMAVALPLLLASCEREQRRLQAPPTPIDATRTGTVSGLRPGPVDSVTNDAAPVPASPSQPVEENAYAVSQGKRLFRWYNCSGCHSAGGGGMGPALMDDEWRYGHEPAQIVASILQGRPNGMPSFAGRMPQEQVWQIAAYVRSMSGQVRADVAPSRGDTLNPGGGPEATRNQQPLRDKGASP